jgi:hypothetical protein
LQETSERVNGGGVRSHVINADTIFGAARPTDPDHLPTDGAVAEELPGEKRCGNRGIGAET